jgi:hypothetical protein
VNEEELRRLYDAYVSTRLKKAYDDRVASLQGQQATDARRVAGRAGVALGPLFRQMVGGMAAAGSVGQRPSRFTTAPQRFAEAEGAVLGGEREFIEQSPLTSVGVGLAGAVPRYAAASIVPGGILGLAAAEGLAARPDESLAGLLGVGFNALDMPGAAGLAERVSQNPIGRAASDLMLGETMALPFRAYRGMRNRRAAGELLSRGDAEMAAMRDRGPTQYGGQEAFPAGGVTGPVQGPAIPMPPAPVIPEARRLGAGGPAPVRTAPETDPQRLLASIAESLQGQRSSPFAPGAVAGPPIPASRPTVAAATREYIQPVGPELLGDPDAQNVIQRLIKILGASPGETGFRNPETRRMAMLGGGAASRHGADVPILQQAGGEGRRMLVPKDNRPGEVVRDVQTRYGRMLAELLEGNYSGASVLTPGMDSPAFRANTPLKTALDASPAPIVPPQRQTSASRQAFPVAPQGDTPTNLFPGPRQAGNPVLSPAGPPRQTTRLDLSNLPGGTSQPRQVSPWPQVASPRNAQWAAGRGTAEAPDVVRRTGAPETGSLVPDAPLDLRRGVNDAPVPTEGGGRSAFLQASNPELKMGDAGQVARGLRRGAVAPELLEYTARGAGGAFAGSAVGAAAGDTPEERRRFAVTGGMIGAGAGAASGPLLRQARQAKSINAALDEVAQVARTRGNVASPTSTPFANTGAPPGIERQVITGAPKVAKASPAPESAFNQPVTRPSTVRPSEEPPLKRLGLSSEMQDIIGPRLQKMADAIRATNRESWEQLKPKAAKLLNVKREALANINPNRMTGAEGLAIASLVRENTESLARLAKEYDSALKLGRTEEVDRIAGLMGDLDTQTTELLATLMAGRSAQGRALQANRVLGNLNSDPTYWIVKGQRVKGADVLTNAERTRITDLLNAGPAKREELMQYIAGLRRTGALGQVAQVRRAGLLTGLTGRLYDFAGTGLHAFEQVGNRVVGSVADRVASAIAARHLGETTAARRSLLAPKASEFGRMMTGALNGAKQAGKSLGIGSLKNPRTWAKFIREAEIDDATLARYDIPRNINITMFGTSKAGQATNKLADTYQKFVMRLSGATDKIWRGAVYNGAIEEQARLVATREGLTGPAAAKRVEDLLKSPTETMVANAVYQGELASFINDGALAGAAGNAIEAMAARAEKSKMPGMGAKAGELVRAGANLLIPFRRTPANILTRVAEHTPVIGWGVTAKRASNWWGNVALLAAANKSGLGTGAENAAVLASQRKMVESLSNNASGMGMVALGAWMYDKGILSGDQPRTPKEAEQWRTEGRMPNAILLNGKWYSVSRLAPGGTVLAIGANAAQAAGGETQGLVERGASFTGNALRTVLDQPMLTGPKEAIDALTTKDDWKRESFTENFAGSFVPSGITAAARMTGEQRQPTGVGEAIRARVPGLKQDVPVRRNIFGEPLERGRGYLLPAMRDQRGLDPLVREMSTVGAQVGAMDRVKGEDPKVYEWRTEHGGRAVRREMERVIGTPRYQNADADTRRDLLEDAATDARRRFAVTIKRQYGIESSR